MKKMIRRWQNLVPDSLPTNTLKLQFSDFNPQENLATFNFAGFVDMRKTTPPYSHATLGNDAYYLNPLAAEKIVEGRNHYGPVFSIQVGTASIEIEECGHEGGENQETCMKLLEHLFVKLNLRCRWQAYSWYYDTGEGSEKTTGTEKEIRALFGESTPE